jgi:hypothetical protein
MDVYISQNTVKKKRIDCKPELVIASLQRFYSSYDNVDKVIKYLNGEAPISLRIIDWFVTKYSRKNFVRYSLNGQDFLVYLSYKGQLKAYSKQYFDPNCRRERIMFKIPKYEQFLTTIGKLNFFRWALECKILDYIEENYEDIKAGYNIYLKETVQNQKRNKNSTASSTDSSATINTVTSTLSAKSLSSIESSTSENNKESNNNYTINYQSANRITRRKRTKQLPSSLNKLQVYNSPIFLDFS